MCLSFRLLLHSNSSQISKNKIYGKSRKRSFASSAGDQNQPRASHVLACTYLVVAVRAFFAFSVSCRAAWERPLIQRHVATSFRTPFWKMAVFWSSVTLPVGGKGEGARLFSRLSASVPNSFSHPLL